MTINLSNGKLQLQVSGTPEQVEAFVSKWFPVISADPKREKWQDNYESMCKSIRDRALSLEIAGSKEMPIAELLGRVMITI